MKSSITRWPNVTLDEIRQQFHLSPSDRLEWVVDGSGIRVIPVKGDPIEAFRGRGAGGSVSRLLAERAKDKERE